MCWSFILLLPHYHFSGYYPRGSLVLLSCITALHIGYLFILAFSRLHLDSMFKPNFDLDYLYKLTIACTWLSRLDTLLPMDGTFLWVSLTSFCHLALSIGSFQSQERVHLFLDTRSIHCIIALFYSFSGLLYEKDKKIKYNKKSGNGMLLRNLMAVQYQFVALEQSTYSYIFPSFGMVLILT